MQLKQVKASNQYRIAANSIEPVLREAKILAARQVYRGHDGTIQELVNYVILGLSENPELSDKLFDLGMKKWEKLAAKQSAN